MEAGADLHPLAMRRRGQRLRAADAARRPVEGCEEAVADGLDGGAAMVAELLSSCPLVRLEELAPAAVAQLGGGPGGVDDVGEQDRGENPVALGGLAAARQELLDLAQHALAVAEPGRVVVARELGQLRVRQVLGEPAAVPDVDEAIVGPMNDQRGHVDARHDGAHVDVEEHLHQRGDHPRADAGAFHAAEPGSRGGVRGHTRRGHLDDRPLAPVRGYKLDAGLGQGVDRQRPRVVRRGRRSRQPTRDHQRLRAVRVGGGEEDGHRRALREAHQCGALAAGCVHHGPHVVHALLECGRLADRIRQAGPAAIEVDHPGKRGQPAQKARRLLQLPDQLEVAREAAHEHEVEIPFAEHLVGDVDVAALRVARFGPDHWPEYERITRAMGFIQPSPPPVDVEEWRKLPHLARIRPLVQDWGINGFGTPTAVYLLYAIKLVIFSVGAALVISATPGIGGLGDINHWWTEPIVFQKLAVWTCLWEGLGLGAGSMPLTFRFVPPIGGVLYWLRPGTVRLPPWPNQVPLTRGTTRNPVDNLLYAGVLATGIYLLTSSGQDVAGTAAGRLDTTAIAVMLGFWALLGMRDKVSFLAFRPEVYGFLLVVFLFPVSNLITASQIVLVCIWWGAASSKLNRHFPFVVSVMISNTPWNRSRTAKARLWRKHPEDMRPSKVAASAAHLGTVMEFTLPLILLVSKGGWLGTIGVVGMIIFHTHITSTFPLAVPLEWNLFMIFGILFLFGHYGAAAFAIHSPLLMVVLLTIGVAIPILGNFRPDLVSFLPSMRYYAGNWATSQWLFRKDTGAEDKLDSSIKKPAPVVVQQLVKVYDDRELAELLLASGLGFRSMHSHGRALNGLIFRALDDVENYHVREGELVSGVVNGWNFGDGHFHDRQLLDAVQERCGFEPGELRIVTLESQPAAKPTQHYRIYDAATGLVEEGYVKVADMVELLPWLDGTASPDFPVEVVGGAGAPTGSEPAATPA